MGEICEIIYIITLSSISIYILTLGSSNNEINLINIWVYKDERVAVFKIQAAKCKTR